MRKTEDAKKAHAAFGYCKHLRPYGKRLANKAVRRAVKSNIKKEDWKMTFESFLLGIFIFIGVLFAISLVSGVIALFMVREMWKEKNKKINEFNDKFFNDKFFKG